MFEWLLQQENAMQTTIVGEISLGLTTSTGKAPAFTEGKCAPNKGGTLFPPRRRKGTNNRPRSTRKQPALAASNLIGRARSVRCTRPISELDHCSGRKVQQLSLLTSVSN